MSFLVASCGCALADAGSVRGASGIGKQSLVMFNTMLNATSPTAHMGQRRGVFDGGAVVARNRIMNESLFHIVPPSFEAGCGGIDLFAGSFSFISAEQFQQLMRAIAANAAGYAFEVALSAMCPTCVEIMEALQKKIQQLNQGYLNSCQLAKGLVNDVASAFNVKHEDQTSLVGMMQGWGDVFETRSLTTGKNPAEQARDNMTATQRQDADLEGNLVWNALVRSDVKSWFPQGDEYLLEAIMSITGSVIVGPPAPAPDGQGDSFDVRPLPGGLISVADLMWGSRIWELNNDAGNVTRHYTKYDCEGDFERCLNPIVRGHAEPVGLVQLTKDLLLGQRRGTESVGLVDKLRFGDVALTNAERAFLENIPSGLGASIRNLARHGRGLARNFADQAAPVIAFEMAQVLMNDLLRAAREAMTLRQNAYTKQVIDQIEAAAEQVRADYQVVSARHGNSQTLLAYYEDLAEQVRPPPGSKPSENQH